MNGYNKTNAEIGARIRELRLKRKMTQEELAESSGICNPQQMSNIERGTAGISLARFIDICRVLNADADYLLFGSTASNAGEILQPYIEKLTPEQLNGLIDIVRIYSDICKK